MDRDRRINIIGAGLAGMSAALKLAEKGISSRLISLQISERAQSNLAEGGINACLDVCGEADTIYEHFLDTCRGGCDIADPNMVAGMCLAAPDIIHELISYGVPFQRENGRITQRTFGGQKKKRTAYVKSSTGKMLTGALIDAVRRFEDEGNIKRYPHHEFAGLILSGAKGDECDGAYIRDVYGRETEALYGPVIMAVGGLNGFFEGHTTGTTANTGDAAAILFRQGVDFGNLEFIQFHPTTIAISDKRLLVSESARGEGGRLYIGDHDYFLEKKYGPRGNLMPRDVISRELWEAGEQAYIDLTGLSKHIWKEKLPDLRRELIYYLNTDPETTPIPVAAGIHFFMGGIYVDEAHRTNINGLYAAGECACAYHGANRLGGNSLLAAIYGGRVAADSAADRLQKSMEDPIQQDITENTYKAGDALNADISDILLKSMTVIRSEASLAESLDKLGALADNMAQEDVIRINLAEAMLMSALYRRESRGAHTVTDYPDKDEEYKGVTIARFTDRGIEIGFAPTPELREEYMELLNTDCLQ